MVIKQLPTTGLLVSGMCTERGARSYSADAVATDSLPSTPALAFAVADGVGDTPAAAHAAGLAADVAAHTAQRFGTPAAILTARAALQEWLPASAGGGGGDCVLVTAAALPDQLGGGFAVSWVGDCRAYVWDGARLERLTTDQTMAEYFRSRRQHSTPRMEHIVTNTVRTTLPDAIGNAMTHGAARLILTTDGVHQVLPAEMIREIVRRPDRPDTTAELLVATALRTGGRDNATAMVIDYAVPAARPAVPAARPSVTRVA